MANVTNVQAVKFCNEEARPLADTLMTAYHTAKRVIEDFTTKGIAGVLPGDSSPVVDGSATDGRTPIVANDVYILLSNATTIVNLFEANTNLVLNQTGKVAVNGGSKV